MTELIQATKCAKVGMIFFDPINLRGRSLYRNYSGENKYEPGSETPRYKMHDFKVPQMIDFSTPRSIMS